MENLLEKIVKNKKAEELGKLNAIKIVNRLFEELMERERDVLTRRFGLHGQDSETLDQIGKMHKLTRERVRQIESASLKKLKKLQGIENHLNVLRETVSQILAEHGGIMDRNHLLDVLVLLLLDAKSPEGDKELYKRHFDFLISNLLEGHIEVLADDNAFNYSYKLKDSEIDHLKDILKELITKIEKDKTIKPLPEFLEFIKGLDAYEKNGKKLAGVASSDLTSVFDNATFSESGELINANKILYSLIKASKNLDSNKFGDWGKSEWPEIKPKKIGDKIYLILKRAGKALHFTEIAEKINEAMFDSKKANAGTVHNELILDKRYTLMERGKYGLKEWKK